MTKNFSAQNFNKIADTFNQISVKYDLINNVLSLGFQSVWRVVTNRVIDPRPGMRILDLAGGTGSSAVGLTYAGADVVVADFSQGMLDVGQERFYDNPLMDFVFADAMDLPFEDDSFDCATISYGLRNVADPDKVLSEMFRVVRPGGKVVICEFSEPKNNVLKSVYYSYLDIVSPVVAKIFGSDPGAYSYLLRSIRSWVSPNRLASKMISAGFVKVKYRMVSNGIVAVHVGVVPE